MDSNQLEQQLRGIGDDRAIAIMATRCALRIVPVMRLWDFDNPQLQRYLLAFFRCMAHVWAKARYQGVFEHRSDFAWHELDLICERIEPIASIKQYSKAVFFAISQTGKAFAGLNVLSDAKAAILTSLRYGDEFQLALDDDFGHLKLEGVAQLAERPLWPDFLSDELPVAKRHLPDLWGEDFPEWQVWVDLYNRYIVDGADGEELFRQIGSQSNVFWAKSPEQVCRQVQLMMAGHGGYSKDPPKVPPDGVSSNGEDEPTPDPMKDYIKTTHRDNATKTDLLGRQAFAEILSNLLDRVYGLENGKNGKINDYKVDVAFNGSQQKAFEKYEGQGFALLLHAPWGKGKTSLWKLLKQRLQKLPLTQEYEIIPPAGRWITVDFNAWEFEHRKRPWMPFLETIKDACQNELHEKRDYPRCEHVGDAWRSWRIGNSSIPWALLLVFVVAFALIGFALFWPQIQNWLGITPVPTLWASFERVLGFTPASPESLGVFLGVLATLGIGGIAAWEVFRRFGRSTAHGGEIAADYYDELKSDPLKKLRKLFQDVTRVSKRPICIFIDDLDRCNATYVVEFLEGIQTHFRADNVFYVVAADRKWLRSAFEQHYSGSKNDPSFDGEHPLGLLFLEKIFQLSVGVPDASDRNLRTYWKFLLNDRTEDGDQVGSTTKRAGDRSVSGRGAGAGSDAEALRNQTSEELNKTVSDIRSGEADRQAKHLLSDLVDILPNNPRSLKRMINLYSIYLVSRGIVGATQEDLPTLCMMRWIIFEQRFLELSEALLAEPGRVDGLRHGNAEGESKDIISRYAGNEAVRAVLGYVGANRSNPLGSEHIKILQKFG